MPGDRPSRRSRTRCLALLAVALLVAVAAACSSDGGGPGGDTAAPTTTTATATTTTPEGRFRVDGDRILGPDGQPFVARGVNLLGPQSFWADETAGLAGAVREWGLNAVRLNTCLPGGCEGADGAVWDVNDDLDGLVEEFTDEGLVVIISLHQIEPGTYPDDAAFPTIASWWQATAARYADNPLVWFNLLNEPGEGTTPDIRWRTVHERLVEVVRAEATNLILLDGTQYGQEAGRDTTGPVTSASSAILRFGPELAAFAPDVAFSVHVYDQWAEPLDDDIARFARLRDYVEAVRSLGLALVIGETGGPANEPDGDLAGAAQTAYAVADALELGLLAWHGQAGDDFSLLVGPDGERADLDQLATAQRTWQGDLLWTLANEPEETVP